MHRSARSAEPPAPARRPGRPGLAWLLPLLVAAGCSQFPSGAPTPVEFAAGNTPATPGATPNFLIVGLDPATVPLLDATPETGLAGSFGEADHRPNLALHPGDVVGVTIFDLGAVPLFGGPAAPTGGTDNAAGAMPTGGHSTALPPQVVETDGSIAIPFAGRVKVGGLTPLQAGNRIVRALAGSATNPQVVVSLVGSSLDSATVGGDVARPGLVPLTLRGERVLDAIAAAGGARDQPTDADVLLTRHGRSGRAGLQHVLDTPADNIVLEPGDSLFVLHDPRSFVVLGAAQKVAQYDFDTERVTLAEAIARAGGPNDAQADVSQLYLLRTEPPDTVQRLLAASGAPQAAAPPRPLPVAYHLDLRHGAGYFLSQQIQMHNKDVVLMTNANSVQLQKIFAVLRNVTGIYYDLKRYP